MNFIYTLFFILLISCSTVPNAQEIVDKAIQVHGGERFLKSLIEFDFRGIHFSIHRNNGMFRYERRYSIADSQFHEILTNDGLKRFLNDQEYHMSDKEYAKYHEDVNSVVYFFLLPYALNDPAVMKRFLKIVTIRGETYFQIEVTFKKEGGGIDYEDRFVHYIHTKNYTLDYFSYADEKGNRFREFKNRRHVNGFIFSDYNNFYEKNQEHQVEEYYKLFNNNQLTLLSTIDTENIKVKLLK